MVKTTAAIACFALFCLMALATAENVATHNDDGTVSMASAGSRLSLSRTAWFLFAWHGPLMLLLSFVFFAVYN
ncbi:uncharacterized protein AMSG_01335 [Thecamonas trahens ATCC 50062]|uniref:Uncharacterized protein n=1 Tax=Thecamonas trahens ATCC 50062 TaxID=461836 RepID=A0A0L0DNQ0_THETB|nr:hypothetical protein AMSG_01335 [Thecamonas trahens ATCC 50062]KNC53626.1 hypothetical protein AMSG_01335 [Thecamonas trahens ATCC 50062]|eukprot:XP_013761943.1 hypothetical protein AMSG_01335 [Thecamonas trahens ATCC 50062]